MTLSTNEYRAGLGEKEASLVLGLAELNKTVFTMKDAQSLIGSSAKEALRGLTKKKWVLRLKRGLFVIVPLILVLKELTYLLCMNLS